MGNKKIKANKKVISYNDIYVALFIEKQVVALDNALSAYLQELSPNINAMKAYLMNKLGERLIEYSTSIKPL